MMTRRQAAWGAGVAVTLGLTGCGHGSASSTKNVFGPDNRVTPDNVAPYKAIGRLDAGCTGTFIGKRLVLTAAHCVIDQKTGTVKPEMTYFRANLRDGKASDILWPDYFWIGTDKPEDDRLRDWAVLRVDKAVGDAYGALPVLETPIVTAVPFTTNLVGYSSDRDSGNNLGLHQGCYVMDIVDGKLFNECDGASGISGAPLINQVNGNWYIIGLAVSEYRQGAPDSVHQGGYSKDYANVAIPATGFAAVVRTLLQTADAGLAAPTISGVVERANPNQQPSPATPGTNPGDPTTGPTTSPTTGPTTGPSTGPTTGPTTGPVAVPFDPSKVRPLGDLVNDAQVLRHITGDLVATSQQLQTLTAGAVPIGLRQATASLVDASKALDAEVLLVVSSHAGPDYRAALFECYRAVKAQQLFIAGYRGVTDPVAGERIAQLSAKLGWIVGQLENRVFLPQ